MRLPRTTILCMLPTCVPQVMSTILHALNLTPGSPSSITTNSNITVNASPGTDLWRKPPSTTSTNAPAYVTYRPLNKFKRARTTVSADWTRLYDQGGLAFYINSQGLDGEKYESWVKTGIEMFDGKPTVGTVATPLGGYILGLESGSDSGEECDDRSGTRTGWTVTGIVCIFDRGGEEDAGEGGYVGVPGQARSTVGNGGMRLDRLKSKAKRVEMESF
ncbi:unnamed protein product [Rhizoctonia solani]|uniref:Uncharacterized protein n=1 Tax=Rhizoctonia solani TaxID=456999 RepID=A0A8H3BQ73_9AGAM|nr:unnamed protein product [Rhizoctonia solani]